MRFYVSFFSVVPLMILLINSADAAPVNCCFYLKTKGFNRVQVKAGDDACSGDGRGQLLIDWDEGALDYPTCTHFIIKALELETTKACNFNWPVQKASMITMRFNRQCLTFLDDALTKDYETQKKKQPVNSMPSDLNACQQQLYKAVTLIDQLRPAQSSTLNPKIQVQIEELKELLESGTSGSAK